MAFSLLTPTMACLADEAVLVQAWKKTSAHIRYHNWFSDTLELDREAVNLPDFIGSITQELRSGQYASSPIRMVPAPKSQKWRVDEDGNWQPIDKRGTASKIRPLAYVRLRDQVVATAVMMCLANRVETMQGDPQTPLDSANLRSMVSYGNRLLCDYADGIARHRWGSTTLYRGFYEDYQAFLARPEKVGERVGPAHGRVSIVQSDLRQFYDRVTPSLFKRQLRSLQRDEDEEDFFAFTERLMSWSWLRQDLSEVQYYAKRADLSDYGRIVLPQGLVAAGFFANLALLRFDASLKEAIGTEVADGLILHDAGRYVDDLRLVISGPRSTSLEVVRSSAFQWIAEQLSETAPGLSPSEPKTQASAFRSDERPLLQQSKRMARIQTAISGGFDPIGGGEVLDAVLALVRAQERLGESAQTKSANPFAPIPDVRDATVDRFAANRFRTTYRALRPMLWGTDAAQRSAGEDDTLSKFNGVRTQKELDDEARAFALELISKWSEDPSNVRLLRIGLDLWPAADVLTRVLKLLRPFTQKGGPRKAPRRVAWYCLSEIFRAGATETGFVEDDEEVPIDLSGYREVLRTEALRVVKTKETSLPWYLKQQAYLFLATNPPLELATLRAGDKSVLQPYRALIRFLLGVSGGLATQDFATYAVLARRSYLDEQRAVALASATATPARLNRIASLDPDFGHAMVESRPDLRSDLSPRHVSDLGLGTDIIGGAATLAATVMAAQSREWLRNEISLLSFASGFLRQLDQTSSLVAIRPSEVTVTFPSAERSMDVAEVRIHPRNLTGGSMYDPPAWVEWQDRWKFHLGFLLRFILTGKPDFTRPVRTPHWKEAREIYRPPGSHWYQRVYGMFSGVAAFGHDWLPITEWTENLLFGLLWWPGCSDRARTRELVADRSAVLRAIDNRLAELRSLQGTSVLLMPRRVPRLFPEGHPDRPLRACVVQTVIPGDDTDFDPDDLTMSSSVTRRRHRRHLSAALANVEQALALRETHKGRDGRLDFLILPELAVHPADVRTHLVRFARKHRSIILAGLAYEELFPGQPLVNSAIWIIPYQDSTRGLQVLQIRQGKKHLAPNEQGFNSPTVRIQPFRPCQWLVGYQYSPSQQDEPLWLTASICFDATDLKLAADLRGCSDVFAIPALNRDVTTFDQMALALHYHMFQMVIVANTGRYGGSNAYAPFKEAFDRQVFHLHGQPQASIAFFELDQVAAFKARKAAGATNHYKFKPAPAGF